MNVDLESIAQEAAAENEGLATELAAEASTTESADPGAEASTTESADPGAEASTTEPADPGAGTPEGAPADPGAETPEGVLAGPTTIEPQQAPVDPVAAMVKLMAEERGITDEAKLELLRQLLAFKGAMTPKAVAGPALVGAAGRPGLVHVAAGAAGGAQAGAPVPAATCLCGVQVPATAKFHQERLANGLYSYRFRGTDPAREAGMRPGILGRITLVLDRHGVGQLGRDVTEAELFTILRAHRDEILGGSKQCSTFHWVYYLDPRNCGRPEKGGATSVLLYEANDGSTDEAGRPLPYCTTNRPVKGVNQ